MDAPHRPAIAAPLSGDVRPRLLHLTYSAQRRGAEVFAEQLAAYLDEEFDQAFCAIYASGGRRQFGAFPTHHLDASQRGLARAARIDVRALWTLTRHLRSFNPDVVIAHGSDTLKYAVASRPAARRRVRFVYRNIGFASDWVGSTLKTRLASVLVRSMDHVVSVGEQTRDDFIRTYGVPAAKVSSVDNAVDATPYTTMDFAEARRTARRSLGLDDNALVAITVGSLSEEKGPTALPGVVGGLASRGVQMDLLVVGDGPQRSELEMLAAACDVRERIHVLGVRTDVPQLLAAADVYLLPSRTEGQPGVLVEAGLAGLPSVAYNVGGVSEIVEDGVTGLLVRCGDRAAFTEASATLAQASPEQRREMGARARALCLQRFDMKAVGSRYAAILHGLIAAHASRRSKG